MYREKHYRSQPDLTLQFQHKTCNVYYCNTIIFLTFSICANIFELPCILNPLSITYFTPVLYPEKTHQECHVPQVFGIWCFGDFPQNWRTKYLGQQEVIKKSEQLDSLNIKTIYGIPDIWFPLSSEKYLVLINSFLVRIHLHFSCLNNCHPDGPRFFTTIIMFVEILMFSFF